ncbi:MAG: selenocysteine-specific translation elongation factor [Rhizomicrobium sp.]
MLIGTAGHVNHGKTSLIRALTGIDTDRLPEEKRRGLSIDLGFAYAERPGERIIGFVDVPGHDHYLHNMIAGVLPLDCVLLVVAADEGPGRQTDEHLEILDLIGTRHLIAVLTKTDRADEAMIAQAEARLRDDLCRTSFAGAKLFRVSTLTGAGIDILQQHLDTLSIKTRNTSAGAGFRLPIDRAFTLPGIGTVVTGTIMSGTVQVGDKLVLTPSGVGARVRSLHAQNRPASSAVFGVRCALAISGPLVEKDKIKRGDVLATPALHEPAERIGVSLKVVDSISLRNGKELQLYHGTGRTVVRLRVVEGEGLAEGRLVELTPAHPIAVLYGDRLLLRDEVARKNIAGGIVIDPFLPGRAISREARSALLTAASRRDHAEALAAMIDSAGFADFERFCLARNLQPSDVQSLATRFAENLIRTGDASVIVSGRSRDLAKQHLVDGLVDYHNKHPQVLGPRKEEALSYMGKQFVGVAAQACLAEAATEELVVLDGACIRLKSHRPYLADADQHLWDKLHKLLQSTRLRPPHVGALADSFALPQKDMESCLVRFEQFGLLTRVAKNRFFLPDTIDQLRVIATELARESDGDGFTAAAFSQKSGVGRNLSIEILEHLDRMGVTKRLGPRRRLL